jgi:sulfur carrier protein
VKPSEKISCISLSGFAAFFMPSVFPWFRLPFKSDLFFKSLKFESFIFQENFFVELTINGDKREVKESQNLTDLVKELDIQAPNFAIALNQQVVPRSKFDSTTIKDNDKVEIVHAVGGGI